MVFETRGVALMFNLLEDVFPSFLLDRNSVVCCLYFLSLNADSLPSLLRESGGLNVVSEARIKSLYDK